MSIYRDTAEELLDGWGAALIGDEVNAVRDELAALADVARALEPTAPGPPRAHDVGSLLEIADLFCMVGVARDEVGTRALDVARACYREIERWPSPWPPEALRTRASRAMQRTYRPHPIYVGQERDALERARGAPLDERPWILGEMHWAKLALEWAEGIEGIAFGESPNLDGPARLAMNGGRDRPELGAVIATAVWKLQTGFVESSRFTDEARLGVARAFVGRFGHGALVFAPYLTAERARTKESGRAAAIELTLRIIKTGA